MSRSGQDASRPPQATTPAGSSAPTPRSRTQGYDHQVVMGLVGLGVVGHVLRSRRFYERLAVAAIAVAALREINQVNRASMMERLSAWNRREGQRLERKAERQSRAVKGAGRMARSGASKDLAGKMREA
jgi:hypothetical protein